MTKRIEPRYIKPELVEIGDTINVVHKEVNGVTVSKLGMVADRQHEKHDTIFYTLDGAELFRYGVNYRPQRVTLLNRVDRRQTLLSLFENEKGA